MPLLLSFQDSNFRTMWYAGALVELTRRLEQFVLSWYVLVATDSPFQLGLVLVFMNAPRPFLAPFSGIIAERVNRHHILLAAQGVNGLVALAILLLSVVGVVQPWHIFLAIFLQGAARAIEDPSRRTAIFDIVGQRRVINAMSLETINNTTGKLLGPVLGGALLSLTGLPGAYGFVLVAHVLALGMLFTVKIPRFPGAASPAASSISGRTGNDSIWQSLKMAVRYALHSPVLVGLLYITIIMNALGFPIQQFVPVIGKEYLGKGPVLVGLLVASEGFGQLIGALSLASVRNVMHPGRIFVAGSVGLLITAMLFVWSPWYALTFVLLTIGGTGQAGFSAMQSSVTMLSSPPEMRGRMMGVLSICIGAGIPLGALEIGAVASAFHTQWAISINALAGLLLILPAIALTPLVWQPFIPPPPPQQAQPPGGPSPG